MNLISLKFNYKSYKKIRKKEDFKLSFNLFKHFKALDLLT